MTLEEAVETILEADAWRDCAECQGKGWATKPHIELWDPIGIAADGTARATRACPPCRGSGGSINEDYVQACKVLGREIPSYLLDRAATWEEKVDRIQKTLAAGLQIPSEFLQGRPADIGVVTGVEKDGENTVRIRRDSAPMGTSTFNGVANPAEWIYKTQ